MAELDLTQALYALRAPALALVVCATGAMDLACTTAGFTRATGSFVTDGFKVGMEVIPIGFPVSTPRIVDRVSASLLTIRGGLSAVASASGRSLTVGLPRVQSLFNYQMRDHGVAIDGRIVGRPYLREEFKPLTNVGLTTSYGGLRRERGRYTLTWYALADLGPDALLAQMQALKNAYPVGTIAVLATTLALDVCGDPAPQVGDFRTEDSWTYGQLSVYWECYPHNAV